MGEQRKLCRRMSNQSTFGRVRQRGIARARRQPTSESESHHAASKRALSKGRWGTGAGTGKSKAARVTSTLPIGSGAGRAATGTQRGRVRVPQTEGGGPGQGPWHRRNEEALAADFACRLFLMEWPHGRWAAASTAALLLPGPP